MFVDAWSEADSNWLRWVNTARWVEEQNMMAIEYMGRVFYFLIKDVNPGEELQGGQ